VKLILGHNDLDVIVTKSLLLVSGAVRLPRFDRRRLTFFPSGSTVVWAAVASRRLRLPEARPFGIPYLDTSNMGEMAFVSS
jgi:hypothetical protein